MCARLKTCRVLPTVVRRNWEALISLCMVVAPPYALLILTRYDRAGAAGNFLASINQLSVNAFKSVMDIDVLGSYHTLKATVPYLIESAKKHAMDSKSRK